ncbi:SAM-dependent methyltransferase [Ornithinimicrobium cavernae]|uniref:SAM-dependent methyltransferase n=1 Tax=Ornithinimicrobium cavernae TaxID=2666047 RepID=UPI000D69D10F|nr:cyclopropane-fatty-acyl-phospholipid synthase family protein [Ornithinimicrobium cavernae]
MTTTQTSPRLHLPGVDDPTCLSRRGGGLCRRAQVARIVLATAARRAGVDLLWPDGSPVGSGEPAPGRPAVEIRRPRDFLERVAHDPKIGIGEAYMAGDWRAAPGTDLASAMVPFAERIEAFLPPWLHRLRFVVDRRPPRTDNSPAGARRHIEAHYDLSNDMFATFLDPSMSYSSARFDLSLPREGQDLQDAQLRKIDAVLDAARVGPGSRVLEIGTGWGSLAVRAARRGARVVTLTLSAEQASLARERVERAGVADRVSIRLQDYREVDGSYDAVVSVEMVEAVGEAYWPAYFRAIDERLAPGGVAAVQAILMSHQRLRTTRRSYGWINKHIFPGGIIPSMEAIEAVTREHTDLRVQSVERFGADYAETLRRWRERFLGEWDRIEARGFDAVFRRRWEFYLAFCQAGFTGGAIDVGLIRLERP